MDPPKRPTDPRKPPFSYAAAAKGPAEKNIEKKPANDKARAETKPTAPSDQPRAPWAWKPAGKPAQPAWKPASPPSRPAWNSKPATEQLRSPEKPSPAADLLARHLAQENKAKSPEKDVPIKSNPWINPSLGAWMKPLPTSSSTNVGTSYSQAGSSSSQASTPSAQSTTSARTTKVSSAQVPTSSSHVVTSPAQATTLSPWATKVSSAQPVTSSAKSSSPSAQVPTLSPWTPNIPSAQAAASSRRVTSPAKVSSSAQVLSSSGRVISPAKASSSSSAQVSSPSAKILSSSEQFPSLSSAHVLSSSPQTFYPAAGLGPPAHIVQAETKQQPPFSYASAARGETLKAAKPTPARPATPPKPASPKQFKYIEEDFPSTFLEAAKPALTRPSTPPNPVSPKVFKHSEEAFPSSSLINTPPRQDKGKGKETFEPQTPTHQITSRGDDSSSSGSPTPRARRIPSPKSSPTPTQSSYDAAEQAARENTMAEQIEAIEQVKERLAAVEQQAKIHQQRHKHQKSKSVSGGTPKKKANYKEATRKSAESSPSKGRSHSKKNPVEDRPQSQSSVEEQAATAGSALSPPVSHQEQAQQGQDLGGAMPSPRSASERSSSVLSSSSALSSSARPVPFRLPRGRSADFFEDQRILRRQAEDGLQDAFRLGPRRPVRGYSVRGGRLFFAGQPFPPPSPPRLLPPASVVPAAPAAPAVAAVAAVPAAPVVSEAEAGPSSTPAQDPVEAHIERVLTSEETRRREAMLRGLLASNQALWELRFGWDVLVRCQGESWQLHRDILSAESDYFREHLRPPRDDGGPVAFTLDRHDRWQLGSALWFMYHHRYEGAATDPGQPLDGGCIATHVAMYIAGASVACRSMMEFARRGVDEAREGLERIAPSLQTETEVHLLHEPLLWALESMYRQSDSEAMMPLRLAVARLVDGVLGNLVVNPRSRPIIHGEAWAWVFPQCWVDNEEFVRRGLIARVGPLSPARLDTQDESVEDVEEEEEE